MTIPIIIPTPIITHGAGTHVLESLGYILIGLALFFMWGGFWGKLHVEGKISFELSMFIAMILPMLIAGVVLILI